MDQRVSNLAAMKVAELKQICKSEGIRHYHGKNCYTKAKLIDAILQTRQSNACDGEIVPAAQEATTTIDMEQKMAYIERATLGTIVAFRLLNGKVKSAKIIKKSTKNNRLMVETEYGAQYIVDYDNVVWVRTGDRWPRGVYKLLKGLTDDETEA